MYFRILHLSLLIVSESLLHLGMLLQLKQHLREKTTMKSDPMGPSGTLEVQHFQPEYR